MKYDLLIIDGRHTLFRSCDAFRDLHVDIGGERISTGGTYGFLSLAVRVREKFGGRVVVAWEGETNFRKRLFAGYKHREPHEEAARVSIYDQEPLLASMLTLIGVDQHWGKDCEADDVIGRLALEASSRGERVAIYSGDSDLRQLVGALVHCISPVKRGALKV